MKNLARSFGALLLFALTAVVIALPSPANAATPAPVQPAVVVLQPIAVDVPASGFNCNTGMLCAYKDANYSGTVTAWSGLTLHQCFRLAGTPLDDAVSSIHNYSTHNVNAQADGCTGAFGFTDHPGESFSNLAGTGWNDVISSFYVAN